MKLNTLALLVVSALTSASAFSATVVNGGTVHFKGELVNAACAVDAGSVDQTVLLGQHRTAKLVADGDTSSSVEFKIQLNDCDTTVSQTAEVAFTGVAIDVDHPTVLAVASSAAGAAGNVGIQILDYKSAPIGLDGQSFSTPLTLKDGTNILPFHARYFATGPTTPGTANAEATFAVRYN